MKKIAKPIIELSNICQTGKNSVVDRLSLSVSSGDRFAVVYKNDDNIELLLDILSGRVAPKKGKIFFKGDDITGTRNNFGIVTKIPPNTRSKTTAGICAAPVVKRGLSRAMADVLVKKELAKHDLLSIADTPVAKLPPYERSMAHIFAAYMCSHEFIVIDEPFFDTDSSKNTHIEKLRNFSIDNGVTLLIFTKDPDLAVELCDYVMIADKNTASNGIIAVDSRKKERALEQITERIISAYK